MELSGVAIPGLSMNSSELVLKSGIHKLQNPEVGQAIKINKDAYTLEDVALEHLKEIQQLGLENSEQPFVFYGMSMGGMVLSILASEHREKLPANSRFVFLVTSANAFVSPALAEEVLKIWFQAVPGNIESFRAVLEPFFSKKFLQEQRSKVEAYIRYRALGENLQSPKNFVRQLMALKNFNGSKYFAKVNPSEATIISGSDDYILGPDHHRELIRLMPGAKEVLLPSVGHMINLEMPEAFGL
jgi:pimeloyl-ACP methyl ester carboxylesterase